MSNLHIYRTRSTSVAAIQYDGTNLEEINRLLVQSKRPPLADLLEVGAWIVFAERSFQILPNSAFQRIYEKASVETEIVTEFGGEQYELPVAPQPLTEVMGRTCYRCTHYAMTNGGAGFCTLFNEGIDSELHAAADCSAYDPEES